jgi:hypothetical protein
MPLVRYFGFVGSVLVLLLIGLGWCLPQPVSEPFGGMTGRPAIRIASVEQLPARVIIDTSLPTIVSPPSVMEFAERWPQVAVADVHPVFKPITKPATKPATPVPASDVPTKQNIANQERSKKVAVHRAAPKANTEAARNDKVPTSSTVTRSSLLDILKEGLGETQAKLMAGLEPLTAYVSKPRPNLQ